MNKRSFVPAQYVEGCNSSLLISGIILMIMGDIFIDRPPGNIVPTFVNAILALIIIILGVIFLGIGNRKLLHRFAMFLLIYMSLIYFDISIRCALIGYHACCFVNFVLAWIFFACWIDVKRAAKSKSMSERKESDLA